MPTSADLDPTFPGPPRLTGNAAQDVATINDYLHDLAARLRTFTETTKEILEDNGM